MTTTPQAALLSDAQIIAIRKSARPTDPTKAWGDTIALARALEAAILAKLQATQAEPVQAGELPDERAAFEAWAIPLRYSVGHVSRTGEYIGRATACAWEAWKARAALAAKQERIYLAMEQAAPPPQTPFDTCPTCEALARTVMMDQTGKA